MRNRQELWGCLKSRGALLHSGSSATALTKAGFGNAHQERNSSSQCLPQSLRYEFKALWVPLSEKIVMITINTSPHTQPKFLASLFALMRELLLSILVLWKCLENIPELLRGRQLTGIICCLGLSESSSRKLVYRQKIPVSLRRHRTND